jgi:type II secretory pathway predicted ATPase ExeA
MSMSMTEPFLYQNFVAVADEIMSLCHFGPSLIQVAGAPGMGKTCLFEYLLDTGEDTVVLGFDGRTDMTPEQVYAAVLQQRHQLDSVVGLEGARKALSQAALSRPVALIVDDADKLPPQTLLAFLDLVAPLSASPEEPVRLVCFTQGHLDEALAALPRQTPSREAQFKIVLQGLAEQEVAPFLAHRLALPLAAVQETYPSARIKKWFRTSRGNPGQILQALHSSRQGDEGHDAQGSGKGLRRVMALAGAFLVMAALTNSWWEPWLLKQQDRADRPSPNAPVSLPPEPVQEDGRPSRPSGDDKSARDMMQTLPPEETASEPEDAAPPSPRATASADPDEPNRSSTDEDLSDLSGGVASEAGQSTAAEAGKDLAASQVADSSHAEDKQATPPLTADEQWLLARPPQHYTLQFAGLSREEDIRLLKQQIAPNGQNRYYRALMGNTEIYKLVHGEFADMEAARTYRDRLPEQLKAMRPWVKSMQAVQDEIRAARKKQP